MIAAGSYTDNTGQQKTAWKEVGVIMTSQAGKEFALLDPTVNLSGFPREPGKDMIIASIFEDKPKQNNQGGGHQAPQQGHATGAGMNNPSSQQQSQYNQQQNPPAAQHLPSQNANTQGNGYQQGQQQQPQQDQYAQGQPVYDQDGQEIPI